MDEPLEKKLIDILLVEDNEADVKITLRAFQKMAFTNRLYVVNDGQEAMDFIFHQGNFKDHKEYPQPDLILLDINVPKFNGFEVLERLKQDKQSSFIPVIMLTSSQNENDIAKSYSLGAASYIPKPIDFGEFLKVVEGFNFYWHIINRLTVKYKI